MNAPNEASLEPTYDEMERLFVNNENLDQIEAYLGRFNPIKVMKMERMEIRHSAILAWLLDPKETHGLGDRFLKAFLGEAMSGQSDLGHPTALDISQSDMRDAEIRCEWQNIDIFVLSPSNQWAFVVENKFDSRQHDGQLEKYRTKIQDIFKPHVSSTSKETSIAVRGIFLTLSEEVPQDTEYASIRYDAICKFLFRFLEHETRAISPEVNTFLAHYLDILEDATGMSEERSEMEVLARQLYRDHKKVFDFVMEHGASSDFVLAVHALFGDNPDRFSIVSIDKSEYVFVGLSSNVLSFLPKSWFDALDNKDPRWEGCDKWWAGYPLIVWFQLWSGNDGTKGSLKLYAEVGPIAAYEVRLSLISEIQSSAKSSDLKSIAFQKGAADKGKLYSRFLKKNSISVEDIHDADQLSAAMKKLLNKFQLEFGAVAEVLGKYSKK